MIDFYMTFFAPAILLSLWGFVFVRLQEAGEVFGWLPNFAARFFTFGRWSAKAIKQNTLPYILFKWVCCSKCHSGVLALAWCIAHGYSLRIAAAFMVINLFISIILEEKYGN